MKINKLLIASLLTCVAASQYGPQTRFTVNTFTRPKDPEYQRSVILGRTQPAPHFRYSLTDQDEASLQQLFEDESDRYHLYDYLLSLTRNSGQLVHRDAKAMNKFHECLRAANRKLQARKTEIINEISLIKSEIQANGDIDSYQKEALEMLTKELRSVARKLFIHEEFRDMKIEGIDNSSDKNFFYRHGMVGKSDEAILELIRNDSHGLYAYLRKLSDSVGEDSQMEFEDQRQAKFFLEALIDERNRLEGLENDIKENWHNEQYMLAKDNRVFRNSEEHDFELEKQIKARRNRCEKYEEEIDAIHLKLDSITDFLRNCIKLEGCSRFNTKTPSNLLAEQ